MALWVCAGTAGCGTKYAVGLFRCPRCHNTEFFEDGDPMAKITRHGGASDATVPVPEEEAEVEVVEAPAPEPEMQEDAGTGEPMQAVDGDELTGDGSGRALLPVPDDAYAPDAVPLEEGPDYEAMTVEQLKEQLGERGLLKSGSRDKLVQRLRDDDAAGAE